MDKEKFSKNQRRCNCPCAIHDVDRFADFRGNASFSNSTGNLTFNKKVKESVQPVGNVWGSRVSTSNYNVLGSTKSLANVSLNLVSNTSKSLVGNVNNCQQSLSYSTKAQDYKPINNQTYENVSSRTATSSILKQSMGTSSQNLAKSSANVDKSESKGFINSGYQCAREGLAKLSEFMNRTPKKENKLPEYNILLLGGTGTGKSTTINAYANYVKFSSFDVARHQQTFVELISSSFKLSHPDMDEEFCVQSGFVDPNESNLEDYQSRTQSPMAYRFTFKDKIIRLIDTPGMGDTGGLAVDRKNFENILEYLKNYQTLHGIVILVKSNETRNVTAFSYCITELFKRLHRSASENVFFCFTFSRTTFYRAGDGFQMLNELLKEEFPDADLTLKPKVNCFFIDNEAYRYLVAKKAGYPFEVYQMETFAEAWNNSASQTEQMLWRITEKVPHDLQSTIKLNMAQKFIAELADPIVQLQKQIYANNKIIRQQKESIESGSSTINHLCQTMKMTVPMIEYERLPAPFTVCTSKNCNARLFKNGSKMDNFPLCCKNCHVENVEHKKRGEKLLEKCKIFIDKNGDVSKKCKNCSCGAKHHMQYRFLERYVQTEVIDEVKQAEMNELLNSKQSNDIISQKIIFALEWICKENEEEIQTIQSVAACFGYLLNKHSNSSVNQFIEPYLELLIEKEKVNMELIKDYPDDVCKMLENLRNFQCDYVKHIEELVATGKLVLQLEKISEYAGRLCHLKHDGPLFIKLINQFLKNNVTVVNHEEREGVSKLEDFFNSMTMFQK